MVVLSPRHRIKRFIVDLQLRHVGSGDLRYGCDARFYLCGTPGNRRVAK
jgi:hypothetical protein